LAPPVEFFGDLRCQKTRLPELSYGFVCVILRLAILVEHRIVADIDRQTDTDGHRAIAYTASRGKNSLNKKLHNSWMN